jgi:hypothetical protein
LDCHPKLSALALPAINKQIGAIRAIRRAARDELFVAVVTVGETCRGIESFGHRGDLRQAERHDELLSGVLREHECYILPGDADVVQLLGYMRAPHPEYAIGKIVAATELSYDLTFDL